MKSGLFSRIRERVQNTAAKVANTVRTVRDRVQAAGLPTPQNIVRGAMMTPQNMINKPLEVLDRVSGQRAAEVRPMVMPEMPQEVTEVQEIDYNDPRFQLSINPNPQSWWQNPAVLIGGAAVVIGGIALIARARR
jgi:hypothetical protein